MKGKCGKWRQKNPHLALEMPILCGFQRLFPKEENREIESRILSIHLQTDIIIGQTGRLRAAALGR